MSKDTLRSKISNIQFKLQYKRKQQNKKKILKPYGFCCSIDNVDPLTKYDRLRSFYKHSLTSTHAMNESPILKFQTEFIDHVSYDLKKKSLKNKLFDTGDHKHKNYKKNKQNLKNLRKLHKIKKLYKLHRNSFNNEDTHNSEDIHDDSNFEDLRDEKVTFLLQGPLRCYLEEEIAAAKDILWEQKNKIYSEEMDKHTEIGKQKTQLMMKKKTSRYPLWYQDFSINQIRDLKMLQCIMHKDCEEMVTGRTQRTLISIGIISTFFKLSPNIIRKLQETCNCNVIEFLREIYKILTGNYFEEERYKKFYDCNERIILSAIAFLTLPETVTELHKRLPPVVIPKLRPKPTLPILPIRQKMESPYEEELFIRPDWATFYNQLQHWQEQHQLMPLPNVILPPKECILSNYKSAKISAYTEENKHSKIQNIPQYNQLLHVKRNPSLQINQMHNIFTKKKQGRNTVSNTKQTNNIPIKVEVNNSTNNLINSIELYQNVSNFNENEHYIQNNKNEEFKHDNIINNVVKHSVQYHKEKSTGLDIPPLYGENRLFDFTINGISEKPGPVEYKICGVLQSPQPNKKSWLDEKHAHYIISGASDEPPTCPVTYEMTGIANVTPTNSNEKFFAVLKLGDGPKMIYPNGRKNLSRHWQEWLQNVDEEFRKVEREANKMIKSIEAVTKLVFPKPTCDSCCSCRQTRKSYIKAKETKAPYFVIDTIIEDDNKNKYIVGSMAMHSPAPTPLESTINLLEVIASEDILTTNVIINGVTNETGETQYFISGSKKDVIHVPARIIEPSPPRPPRNVPPCVCTIQQIFSKGLIQAISHDNIPWTKEDGLCFGKRFRPQESPAYSCKTYPGDKSCRRSPFMNEIIKLKKKAEREEKKEQKCEITSKEKKMYSIADFQPCGDEHGMSICGGPWNVLHTLTPEELEEQEKLRKEILRGPPCGTKPGQAVCEGPFGARIPPKPPQILIEEEIPGEEEPDEEEEEDIEEEEKIQVSPVKVKEKEKKRDKKCHMSPESIATREKVVVKKIDKFIPDPTYHGYDDPWNIFRTAPSVKESETDFKKLLKLSSPKPPATPIQSKTLINKTKKSALQEYISEVRELKKVPPIPIRDTSENISKKRIQEKFKNREEIDKIESTDKKIIRNTETKKLHDQVVKSDITEDKIKDQNLIKSTRTKRDQKLDKEPLSFKYLKKQSDKSKPKKSSTTKEIPFTIHERFEKQLEQIRNLTNYDVHKQDKNRKSTKKLSHKTTLLADVKKKKISKQSKIRKKSVRRDKKKDVHIDQDVDPETIYKNKVHELKNMMKSSKIYPYDVKPVDISDNPPTKCQREYEDIEFAADTTQDEEDIGVQLPSKGPCGWKTKSEQQLSTKKTLVYLHEPDYPPETVAVKSGGKPCICLKNRAKKKILLYNIAGLIGGKKVDGEKKLLRKKKDEDKKMQVIDGAIYYTPPPSLRRSDEYVPEYDLYESPYDMCLTERKNQDLQFLEQYSRVKVSKVPGNKESCDCNDYIDTYGIQATDKNNEKAQLMKELYKTREKLINAKPQRERWDLALKDVGLIDYFVRCRDNMPCWLKCAKFNKMGCAIPYQKLKTKQPVCECKYERKILEHREEKVKWKERQKRLKSLKKQPYVNITNISKLLIPNTKLMISGVKRIPKEDEYVDDIKYCITGVAENYSHLPPKQVVGGVYMVTPIQTPEPSEHKIPCVCLHRHWSPMKIPPGPLLKPEEILLAKKKRRQEAVKEAFRQIYAPQPIYHTHNDHSCKEKCSESSEVENDENIKENNEIFDNYNIALHLKKPVEAKNKLTNSPKYIKQYVKSNIDYPRNKIEVENVIRQKHSNKIRNSNKEKNDTNMTVQKAFESKVRNLQKGNKDIKSERVDSLVETISTHEKRAYKEIKNDTQLQNNSIELDIENIDISNKENKKSFDNSKSYLMAVLKIELKKMATEGYLFAKLPKCFLMPQLRYWLMYREGIALSNTDKYNSIRKSVNMWNMIDTVAAKSKIKPPPLKMMELQQKELTFDNAQKIKKEITMKKNICYSQLRKERVLYGRSMWNSMEHGKFPSISFKQAYFTYMASKEADGHVFKPWLPSEVREMN
ncbi:PREDICTED: uncharacterized protein LOC108545649 [Eufriesea mexicana]|uniref:uncharacterized protein LOC108545649 n=1 Tax=Eufriesea mexicana TaxID=516756 RepID=UPI00083C0934|nr:PREDICTED: uncharacterized protein LOC108545649 [Eufriesea mexicana]